MRTVLAHGCYDLFHYGHLRHLLEARRLGDRLVVSVTRDEFVNKGEGRPVFNLYQRMAMLDSLKFVSDVIASHSAGQAIRRIRPSVYVKGREYEGRLPEQALVEELGGKVVFTDTPVFSSTAILTGEFLRLRREIVNDNSAR